MVASLLELTRQHAAKFPALTLDGFSRDHYGRSIDLIDMVASGKRRASNSLLLALNAAHTRLFPGLVVSVPLPDQRVAHLSEQGLTITFPKTPTAQ